ncbi:Aste57867_764 [Aphanomyces stellatus]|uniref:DNA topoisomerase 2 n=1 Tax=Aphanomyces stellatus TaxID=120398 RepID=A0A485K642_9STRA|nr:hypothetical protein As57867_000763 [Aphanomyces stellatus]VFT77988.1 Aste57867_764 [Aphanomyces stellatus]
MLRLLGRRAVGSAGRHTTRRLRPYLPHEVPCLRTSMVACRPLHVTSRMEKDASSSSDSIEHMYQKKTPLEHVLLRPGMYIGSVESIKESMWLWSDAEQRMVQRTLEYVPALYKIFDEILVNAVDNKVRDETMSRLEVDIDVGTATRPARISIFNDGKGIPVQFHKAEQVYVPELVLGHLLTGSNFNDSTARLTGGRHGYGAKLTNIFSRDFTVETGDAKAGLRYKQTWRDNMRERGEPEITPYDGHNFTHISFTPDLAKFHRTHLDEDMAQVLAKRVVDVAGCLPGVLVKLNGRVVPLSGFESYVQAFQGATTTTSADDDDVNTPSAIYTRVNKRWEVAVLPSDVGFTQVSFVNGMSTTRGGTHVQLVLEQLCRRVAEAVAARHRDLGGLQASQIKPHIALFVKCLVENPTFDSQMKECLTSKPEFYGSTCALTDKYLRHVVASSGIVDRVVAALKTKHRTALMKKVAKKAVHVPKLEDANWAGTSKASDCTLILTEGDSAKALAVAGLSVVGRDAYGVFPLRGKFLNVRDATDAQLTKNAEFGHLCTILGLKPGLTYETASERATLRYGHVMLMTDQDQDGSHIKGLLLNLFHTFWPALLETSYVSAFLTPLLKVHQAKDKTAILPFFSVPEYEQWKRAHPTLKHHVKYYKGLGTSTSKEGKAYFNALAAHQVGFTWTSPDDGDALAMVFSKDRVADRKVWLSTANPHDYVFERCASMPLGQFVHSELVQFSLADNVRSIPNVVDGLKPSQRKVLFACFRRNLTKEMKVAQLAGYCAEHTAYHHGEASLHSTIVNMAQDYVGANNVPLLVPSGQFGTRLQGGKDAASPRYIFTHLQPYTRLIYPAADEPLLEYVQDDGVDVEPRYYVPILPMLLVNGADGIGTGWSTSVPSHHPIELIDCLLRRLSTEDNQGTESTPCDPWIKGFQGTMTKKDNGFVTEGVVHVIHEKKRSWTVQISELPVGKWIEDYKAFLWGLVATKKIQSFAEHHTDQTVRFDVIVPVGSFSKDDVDATKKSKEIASVAIEWTKFFKLESNVNTTNMHAFDSDGKLTKYDSSNDIVDAFYPVRLALYDRRKAFLETKITREVKRLQNRVRFVQAMASDESALRALWLSRPSKAQVVALLQAEGFDPASAFRDPMTLDEDDDEEGAGGNEFDYLLKTSFLQFTHEFTTKLQGELEAKEAELARLEATSAVQMWQGELEALKAALLATDPQYARQSSKSIKP